MKILCINNANFKLSLTVNKYYNVIEKDKLGFKILDDANRTVWYASSRFKPINQDRNDKLNKLLK